MTKVTNLSAIRAAAGRKGGLAKAANRAKQKKRQEEAYSGQLDYISDVLADILDAMHAMTKSIDNLSDKIVKNPPPPVSPEKPKRKFATEVDNKTAKRNIFAGLAGANASKNDGFSKIARQNKELDDMILSKRSKKDGQIE